MSLDDLLVEIHSRGLAIVMVQHQVTLHGPKEQATATLLAVLRWHKRAIASHLAFRREKVWEWNDGKTYQAIPWSDEWHPPGATLWRWVSGEDNWVWKVIREEHHEQGDRAKTANGTGGADGRQAVSGPRQGHVASA